MADHAPHGGYEARSAGGVQAEFVLAAKEVPTAQMGPLANSTASPFPQYFRFRTIFDFSGISRSTGGYGVRSVGMECVLSPAWSTGWGCGARSVGASFYARVPQGMERGAQKARLAKFATSICLFLRMDPWAGSGLGRAPDFRLGGGALVDPSAARAAVSKITFCVAPHPASHGPHMTLPLVCGPFDPLVPHSGPRTGVLWSVGYFYPGPPSGYHVGHTPCGAPQDAFGPWALWDWVE